MATSCAHTREPGVSVRPPFAWRRLPHRVDEQGVGAGASSPPGSIGHAKFGDVVDIGRSLDVLAPGEHPARTKCPHTVKNNNDLSETMQIGPSVCVRLGQYLEGSKNAAGCNAIKKKQQ